jgi:hypothetical protein
LTVALSTDCATRPTHRSGVSVVNSATPTTIDRTTTARPDVGRRFQPSVDRRPSQHRRHGQHGEGERRRDLEPGRRGQGGRGITPVQPGSAQQHDRRGRRRPGHDPAEGVAGQLRTRDREPAGHTERDPVEVPQADPARELEEEHERREGPVEVLEGSPRGKDRDEAGQEDLERDRRDDQERDRFDERPDPAEPFPVLERSIGMRIWVAHSGSIVPRVLGVSHADTSPGQGFEMLQVGG